MFVSKFIGLLLRTARKEQTARKVTQNIEKLLISSVWPLCSIRIEFLVGLRIMCVIMRWRIMNVNVMNRAEPQLLRRYFSYQLAY